MPTFRVVKGQDAYAIYETIVEAETAEQAEIKAMSWSHSGKWVPTGETREFDDSQLMEGETEEVPAGEILTKVNTYGMTSQERNTVLAALRFYQQENLGDPMHRPDDIHEIATNGETEISLDADAVDSLCEKLNV